jgi:hypothetical protein
LGLRAQGLLWSGFGCGHCSGDARAGRRHDSRRGPRRYRITSEQPSDGILRRRDGL